MSITSTVARCWSTCTASPRRRCMSVIFCSTETLPSRPAAISSGAASPTFGFMYWMVVWSLHLLGLLGSFTLRALGLGGDMLGAAVLRRSVLLRTAMELRGAGCTAAGTWRAGAGMGFWSLWGVRTISLRYAVFALSLGRSRQRWLGTRACRRRLLLRARIVWGVRSLLAMLLWRLGGKRMRRGCVRMLGRGCPTTWCRPRSVFWSVWP